MAKSKPKSNIDSANRDRVADLEAEVKTLRSRLTMTTIVGVVAGSGGLLGLYKWVAIEQRAQELAFHKTEMEMINAAFDATAASYKRTQEQLDELAASPSGPQQRNPAHSIIDLEARRREEIQSKCALCHPSEANASTTDGQSIETHR